MVGGGRQVNPLRNCLIEELGWHRGRRCGLAVAVSGSLRWALDRLGWAFGCGEIEVWQLTMGADRCRSPGLLRAITRSDWTGEEAMGHGEKGDEVGHVERRGFGRVCSVTEDPFTPR